MVDGPRAADDLRRDVGGGAQEHARLGELAFGLQQPGDPEVQQLQALDALAGEEEVVRLDVAVDDPPLVRAGQGQGGPPHDRQHLPQPQRLAVGPHVQALPLQPLHGQEVLLVRLAVGHVADDGRMGQGGQDGRLLREPFGVPDLLAGQNLQRDRRAVDEVMGTVDRAHAAGAGFALDPKSACNDGADHSLRVRLLPQEDGDDFLPHPIAPPGTLPTRNRGSSRGGWCRGRPRHTTRRPSSGSGPWNRRTPGGWRGSPGRCRRTVDDFPGTDCRSRQPPARDSRGLRDDHLQGAVLAAHRDLDVLRRRRSPATGGRR